MRAKRDTHYSGVRQLLSLRNTTMSVETILRGFIGGSITEGAAHDLLMDHGLSCVDAADAIDEARLDIVFERHCRRSEPA